MLPNRLRCGFTRFNLCRHFPPACGQRIKFAFVGGDCGFLLLYSGLLIFYLTMLLVELIKQHRVDRFVAFSSGCLDTGA